MPNEKKAPAKNWRQRELQDWNTLTFTEYLKDAHKEKFGIDYAPMRSWRLEQGQIGGLIGTRDKPRKMSNEDVKKFIDECFATYAPSAQYPGTNFGFSYSYRRNILQRIQAESQAQARRKEAVAESDNDNWDEVSEWL